MFAYPHSRSSGGGAVGTSYCGGAAAGRADGRAELPGEALPPLDELFSQQKQILEDMGNSEFGRSYLCSLLYSFALQSVIEASMKGTVPLPPHLPDLVRRAFRHSALVVEELKSRGLLIDPLRRLSAPERAERVRILAARVFEGLDERAVEVLAPR
jgi:hypothetical protein